MKLSRSKAYVGVGSNLGKRFQNCLAAVQKIHSHSECCVSRVSSVYETEPISHGTRPQGGWYLNAVLELDTSLNSIQLLRLLLQIEHEMGRKRSSEVWGPRVIDLDLLFFNHEITRSSELTLPHPGVDKRRFVLEPLAEIIPDFLHPLRGLTISQLLRKLKDNKKVIPLFNCHLVQSSGNFFEGSLEIF